MVDVTLGEVLNSAPALMFPIIVWLVFKVISIENKVLGKMESDITELKTDMKWLVNFHQAQTPGRRFTDRREDAK